MKRKLNLVLILVVILLIAGFITMRVMSTSGTKLLQRAGLAIRAQQFDKAVELVERYQQKDPDNADAAYLKAMALERASKFDKAAEAIEAARKLNYDAYELDLLTAQMNIDIAHGLLSSDAAEDIARLPQLLDKADSQLTAIEASAPEQKQQILQNRLRAASMAQRAWAQYSTLLASNATAEFSRREKFELSSQWDELLADLPQWRRPEVIGALKVLLHIAERKEKVRLSDLRYIIAAAEKSVAGSTADPDLLLQARIALADSLVRATHLAVGGRVEAMSLADCQRAWQLTEPVIQSDSNQPHALQVRSLVSGVYAARAMEDASAMVLELLTLRPDDAELIKNAAANVQRSLDAAYADKFLEIVGGYEKLPVEAALILSEYELGIARSDYCPGELLNQRLAKISSELETVNAEKDSDIAMLLAARASIACEMGDYDALGKLLTELETAKGAGKVSDKIELLRVKSKIHTSGLSACEDDILTLQANYPNMFDACELMAQLALEKSDSANLDQQIREMTRITSDINTMTPIARADARCRMADIAIQMNNITMAARLCQQVQQIYPAHMRARTILVMAEAYSKQDSAVALLQFAKWANNTSYQKYVMPLIGGVSDRAIEFLASDVEQYRQLDMSKDDAPRAARQLFYFYRGRLEYLFVCCQVYQMFDNDAGSQQLVDKIQQVAAPSAVHARVLSEVLFRLDRSEKAVEILSDPQWIKDPTCQAILLDYYARNGRLDEISTLADQLIAAGLNGEAIKLMQAMIFSANDRDDKADELLGEIEAASDSVSDALRRRIAEFYVQRGEYYKALAEVNQISELSMALPEYMALKIEVLSAGEMEDELTELCEYLLSGRQPAEMLPAACRQMVRLYSLKGRLDDALQLLERLENTPDTSEFDGRNWTEAKFAAANVLADNGLYARSAEICYELVQRGLRGNDAGLLILGRALVALDKPGEAREVLEMIESGTSQYLSGKLLLVDMIDQPAERLEMLKRISTSYPDEETLLVRRMSLLAEQDPYEAVRLYYSFANRQGAKLNISPAISMAVASILWQQDDKNKAIELLAHAYQCSPSNMRAMNYALLATLAGSADAIGILSQQFDLENTDSADIDPLAAAMAVAIAATSGDDSEIAKWASKYKGIELTGSASDAGDMLASLDALVKYVIGGDVEESFASVKTITGYGRLPIEQLADSKYRPAAADVLLAAIAQQVGQNGYARSIAVDVLNEYPDMCWAAAIAFGNSENVDAASEVLEKFTGDKMNILMQAQLAAMQNDYAKAAELAAQINSQLEDGYFEGAMVLWLSNAGQLDKAIALAIESYNHYSLAATANSAAYLLSQQDDVSPEDMQKAFELITQAHERLGDDPNLLDTMGWIEYRRGDYTAAREHLAVSVAAMPGSPVAQYHMAMVDLALGDTKIARMRFEAAADIPEQLRQQPDYLRCAKLAAEQLAELDKQ